MEKNDGPLEFPESFRMSDVPDVTYKLVINGRTLNLVFPNPDKVLEIGLRSVRSHQPADIYMAANVLQVYSGLYTRLSAVKVSAEHAKRLLERKSSGKPFDTQAYNGAVNTLRRDLHSAYTYFRRTISKGKYRL